MGSGPLCTQRSPQSRVEDYTEQADIYAVYPQQLHLSARVRSLIDFLVERFSNINAMGEDSGHPED